MKVIDYVNSDLKDWCDRNGYDLNKILIERMRNRVVLLLCERVYEANNWKIIDWKYPVVVINPDSVWLYKDKNPYKDD